MKKKYCKPELLSVKIDNTITLVMYSNETTPPDEDPFPGGGGAPAATPSDLKTNSFERSPFNDTTTK